MAIILVTGSTGFIGGAVADELERRGHEVRRASRSAEDISIDLTSLEAVGDLPEVDVVVNAAGRGDINGLDKDIESWRDLNREAVENLASRYRETRFIHLSSLAAMGLGGSYYWFSDPKPVLPYSRSKKESEDAVKENFEHYTIIRPGEVFDEENIPFMLRLFGLLKLKPNFPRKTPAIHVGKLADLIADVVEADINQPVLAAREYEPSEILQRAGRLGSRSLAVRIPVSAVEYAGYLGEILRKIGFRAPGIVRARSIIAHQKVENAPEIESILED